MKNIFLALLICFMFACSSSPSSSLDENPTVNEGVRKTYLLGSDFISEAQLFEVDFENPQSVVNTKVTGLGSSAILRVFNDKLHVLHDGFSFVSANNIQIIDQNNNFKTLKQFSTGTSTNPHDIWVEGDEAFITLYNPKGDPDLIDSQGNPGDLLVMDLNDGETISLFSFAAYLNNDSYQSAHAGDMARAGNRLLVLIQDLGAEAGTFYIANAPGKLAVFNLENQTLEKVIPLQGQNPTDIVYSEKTGLVYVACMAAFNPAINGNDTSSDFGGIEIIDLNQPENSVFIDDEDLGGYVERLALSENNLLTIVSHHDASLGQFLSDVVVAPLDFNSGDDFSLIVDGQSDIRDFQVDSENRLWVAFRSIHPNDKKVTSTSVSIYDLGTNELMKTLEAPISNPNFSLISIVFE